VLEGQQQPETPFEISVDSLRTCLPTAVCTFGHLWPRAPRDIVLPFRHQTAGHKRWMYVGYFSAKRAGHTNTSEKTVLIRRRGHANLPDCGAPTSFRGSWCARDGLRQSDVHPGGARAASHTKPCVAQQRTKASGVSRAASCDLCLMRRLTGPRVRIMSVNGSNCDARAKSIPAKAPPGRLWIGKKTLSGGGGGSHVAGRGANPPAASMLYGGSIPWLLRASAKINCPSGKGPA